MTIVRPATGPPPFRQVYFHTVFLVPEGPRRWPPRFAVVTAHNPGGVVQAQEANERAEHELERELEHRGIESFEAIGASADLRHQERGRAFAADLATVAEISRRFGQEAFFWIEDDVLSICTDASGRGWPVGRWSERLVR